MPGSEEAGLTGSGVQCGDARSTAYKGASRKIASRRVPIRPIHSHLAMFSHNHAAFTRRKTEMKKE